MVYNKARFRNGETIIVTAASGGVGGFAVQFARLAGLFVLTAPRIMTQFDSVVHFDFYSAFLVMKGAHVIGTTSASNVDYVRSLGCDDVIDYKRESVTNSVRELTSGRGVDFWLDLVGGEQATEAFSAMAFNGLFITALGTPNVASMMQQGNLFMRGQGNSEGLVPC